MTELNIYKWIQSVECHYNHDYSELWACPNTRDLDELFKIVSPNLFDDGGLDIKLLHGYVAIDLIPISEYYGIEIGNVLEKVEDNQ